MKPSTDAIRFLETLTAKISGFTARFALARQLGRLPGSLITYQSIVFCNVLYIQWLLSRFIAHCLPRVTLRVSK